MVVAKARKFKIPLVSREWVFECLIRHEIIDIPAHEVFSPLK